MIHASRGEDAAARCALPVGGVLQPPTGGVGPEPALLPHPPAMVWAGVRALGGCAPIFFINYIVHACKDRVFPRFLFFFA